MTRLPSKYFDEQQYAKSGIASYELVYGRNFISPGGKETSAEFLKVLGLQSDMKVLDIGCGIGGCAFQIAADYGANVDGVDISHNMIEIGSKRCDEQGLEDKVKLYQGDCLEIEYDTLYDVAHSRDVFLHIHDKSRLFSVIRNVLIPGGLLAFTDYCRGEGARSAEFNTYVRQRAYCLHTVDEYRDFLQRAGFVDIKTEDKTSDFLQIHKRELDRLVARNLNAEGLDDLIRGWRAKIVRIKDGEQRWGWFLARNPG
ncbi:MAG: methyltransferase domain-containing protein [Gammaproteobacteria bacterium]|nr:methyltransferase domain-containing protein [Gammaproteobacteria bacterium]